MRRLGATLECLYFLVYVPIFVNILPEICTSVHILHIEKYASRDVNAYLQRFRNLTCLEHFTIEESYPEYVAPDTFADWKASNLHSIELNKTYLGCDTAIALLGKFKALKTISSQDIIWKKVTEESGQKVSHLTLLCKEPYQPVYVRQWTEALGYADVGKVNELMDLLPHITELNVESDYKGSFSVDPVIFCTSTRHKDTIKSIIVSTEMDLTSRVYRHVPFDALHPVSQFHPLFPQLTSFILKKREESEFGVGHRKIVEYTLLNQLSSMAVNLETLEVLAAVDMDVLMELITSRPNLKRIAISPSPRKKGIILALAKHCRDTGREFESLEIFHTILPDEDVIRALDEGLRVKLLKVNKRTFGYGHVQLTSRYYRMMIWRRNLVRA